MSDASQIMCGPPGGLPAEVPRCFEGFLFDMGDVLFDATLWRRWLWRLVRRLGVTHGYDELFAFWDEAFLDDVHRAQRDYGEAFEAFLAKLALSRAQIDEVVAASRIRKREIESNFRPLPGVRATIERLDALGVPLAVVSDSEQPAAILQQLLERLGLGGRFCAVVSSHDLGCTKPDPRCYAAALDALRLHSEQAAFVGHDAVELAGARAVGLTSIGFNHPPQCEAEIHLRHFRELLGYSRHLGALATAG